jgi:hypothetical protein
MASTLSPADRAAGEAYLSDLKAGFRASTQAGQRARDAGDRAAYVASTETRRELYREIAEVAFALSQPAGVPLEAR